MPIKDNRLARYADELEAAGFTIYEPKSGGSYFTYSRVVDGVECFGYVQADYWGEISHSMPILPSRENGSSAIVKGVPDTLTIASATAVASLYNDTLYCGVQKNYNPVTRPPFIYVKRGA